MLRKPLLIVLEAGFNYLSWIEHRGSIDSMKSHRLFSSAKRGYRLLLFSAKQATLRQSTMFVHERTVSAQLT